MGIDIGVRQTAKFLRNFDAQALNLQPLRPNEVGFRLFGNMESCALNPQPLPPKELSKLFGSLFNSRFRNPQPLLPTEEAAFAARISNPADAVGLNPQPLPPKGETAFSAGLSTSLDSVVTGLAKKAGFGPILNKIKALVKPLLENVLQKAIGNLPSPVPLPPSRWLIESPGGTGNIQAIIRPQPGHCLRSQSTTSAAEATACPWRIDDLAASWS